MTLVCEIRYIFAKIIKTYQFDFFYAICQQNANNNIT